MEFANRSGPIITANGTSAVTSVVDLANGLTVTVEGTFDSASVQAEISMDGTSFAAHGAPVTAAGTIALPPCRDVRFETASIVTAAALNTRFGGIVDTGNAGKARR